MYPDPHCHKIYAQIYTLTQTSAHSDIHVLIPEEFNTHRRTYSATLDRQNTPMHTNTHHDTPRYTSVSTNTQPETHNINYSPRHSTNISRNTHKHTTTTTNRHSNIAPSPNMYRCTGRPRDNHVNIIRHINLHTQKQTHACKQPHWGEHVQATIMSIHCTRKSSRMGCGRSTFPRI